MVEINLLPQQERKRSEPPLWLFGAIGISIIAIATVLIWWFVSLGTAFSLQKEINAVEGDINSLQDRKNEYDRLMVEKITLEKVTNVAKKLTEEKTYWSNDLADFTAKLPTGGGIALESLSMKPFKQSDLTNAQAKGLYVGKDVNRIIEIRGSATSQQSVISFLEAFEESDDFDVDFKSLQRENDETTNLYNFSANVGVIKRAEETVDPNDPNASDTTQAADGTADNAGTPAASTPAPAPAAPAPAPATGGTP